MPIELHVQEDTLRVGICTGIGIKVDIGVGEDEGLAVGVGIGDDVGVGAAGGVGKVIVKISTKSEYPVLLFPPPNNI